MYVKVSSDVAQHYLDGLMWFSTCVAVVVVGLNPYIGCGCTYIPLLRCFPVFYITFCNKSDLR